MRIVSVYERLDEENLKILKENTLFSHLPAHELTNIYLQLVEKTHPRGHVFYKEGQASDKFYFIRNGEVEVKNFETGVQLIFFLTKIKVTKISNNREAERFKKELNLQGLKSPLDHKLLKKHAKAQKPVRVKSIQ